MQELVQFVDLCEMELEEVLSCCLQVGTVHTVGQGGNTCRGRQNTAGTDLGEGVHVLIQGYLSLLFLPRQFVASICPLRNSTHIFFTGSIWYWLAASSSDWTLLLFTDILTHGRQNVNNPHFLLKKKKKSSDFYCHPPTHQPCLEMCEDFCLFEEKKKYKKNALHSHRAV